MVRYAILVVVHPILRLVLEVVFRNAALENRAVPPHHACGHLFTWNAVTSLIGRFFVVTAGQRLESVIISILFLSIQQFITRANRVARILDSNALCYGPDPHSCVVLCGS